LVLQSSMRDVAIMSQPVRLSADSSRR